MAVPPLHIATPEPETFRVSCPCCGHITEGMEFEQDDGGAWHAEPADCYPLCEACDVQFEIGRVLVLPVPR